MRTVVGRRSRTSSRSLTRNGLLRNYETLDVAHPWSNGIQGGRVKLENNDAASSSPTRTMRCGRSPSAIQLATAFIASSSGADYRGEKHSQTGRNVREIKPTLPIRATAQSGLRNLANEATRQRGNEDKYSDWLIDPDDETAKSSRWSEPMNSMMNACRTPPMAWHGTEVRPACATGTHQI